MPINFQEIYQQIQTIGKNASERRKTLEERRQLAHNLLAAYSTELDWLKNKVEQARRVDANVRCASPVEEVLLACHPAPAIDVKATVIAADGSQILPDRHAAYQYFVINVGAITMQVGSGNTPQIITDTEIHMLDEFDDTYFSESQVALQRDVAERKKLLELSKPHDGTVIALTEGQLELWGSADNENAKSFEKSLQDYLNVLRELENRRVITAGYVDKPGANWLIRLLELMTIPDSELKNLRKHRPLLGVTDLWLAGQLLGSYERSAVLKLQARSADVYDSSIAIHFFYINMGDQRTPKIARVDIPAWIANRPELLDLLHHALVEQAKIAGGSFPYLLHRAHEIAVVTHREKEEIDQMLAMVMRNNGGEIGQVSGKQAMKNLPGRSNNR